MGMPIIFILGNASADGRFIGLTLIIVTFPLTNMALIIGPKIVKVYKDSNQRTSSTSHRGSRGHVRVTGISGESATHRHSNDETMAAISGIHPQTVTMD